MKLFIVGKQGEIKGMSPVGRVKTLPIFEKSKKNGTSLLREELRLMLLHAGSQNVSDEIEAESNEMLSERCA